MLTRLLRRAGRQVGHRHVGTPIPDGARLCVSDGRSEPYPNKRRHLHAATWPSSRTRRTEPGVVQESISQVFHHCLDGS